MKFAHAIQASLVLAAVGIPTARQLTTPAFQDPQPEAATASRAGAFTDEFFEAAADLQPTGRNPYFVLEPGWVQILEGKEDGEDVKITITVLDETQKIDGVETRVVEEKEEKGGKIEEVTRDYFAISTRTNNVYYFGENVDVYEDGKVAGHKGSWLAGVDGARYGLMLPGSPLVGARYQEEVAPGKAMDRGEVVDVAGNFECRAGRFEHVLAIVETTPLEKGSEKKRYARGVGLLQDGNQKLTRYGKGLK
jgi:hypothetical protein